MKATEQFRILVDFYGARGLKRNYWALAGVVARLRRLRLDRNRAFARIAGRDQWAYWPGRVLPVQGEIETRAKAAAAWLLRAQQATPDGGVSLGYFPCDAQGSGWRASYPETTGYIIQTLVDYAHRFKQPRFREQALAMANWEVDIQMASGAVQGGPLCPPAQQRPAVFNTGMVLQGFTALLETMTNPPILAAAHGAAGFLLRDLDKGGHFRTHGPWVTPARIKTYNVLCAWALYRLGVLVDEKSYREGALKAARAALGQQSQNGWFAHNCLNRPEAPLTHTLGYTLQGLLEVGLLAGEEALVAGARRGVDPLIGRMGADGFLHGRFHSDWTPGCFSACLTGSAQVAMVCFRLFESGLGEKYRQAGNRLLDFLKPLQSLSSTDEGLNGALAGSFPLFLGGYMTAGYPNWATKYFLDALLLQDRLG